MQTEVARFLQFLAVERNASDLTIKSYREDLQHLMVYLAERSGECPPPENITTLDLRGYLASLQQAGYAKTTTARRLASLRSFFRFGQREGWATSNPARPLRNPRKSRSLPHFLSGDEIGTLLSAPPANNWAGLRDRAILETMYSAGLRVSELVGLNDETLTAPRASFACVGKAKRSGLRRSVHTLCAPSIAGRKYGQRRGVRAQKFEPAARGLCSSINSARALPPAVWRGCWKNISS
jgi:integrase/recombinase XerC